MSWEFNGIPDDDIGMIDKAYDGHHDGYTYVGGGRYSNNIPFGCDMYVEVDDFGNKEYHTDM